MGRAMLRAGIHSGEYYEASNAEGGLIGFLMTMPPGQDMFSTFVYEPLQCTFRLIIGKQGRAARIRTN